MALLRFSLQEALASLRRGWPSAGLALVTVTGVSTILAVMLWGAQVAAAVLDRVASVVEVSVFVSSDAPPAALSELRRVLVTRHGVDSVEHVSADEARARLVADFPDARSVVEGMSTASMPASFEVRLRSGAEASAEARQLVEEVRTMPGVEGVRYDGDLIARVAGVATAVRAAGSVIGVLLLLVCATTVTSVVRLTYEARRDEVEILYLVGAPERAIRGPFAAEGALLSLAGASAACGALVGGIWLVHQWYAGALLTTIGAATVPYPHVEVMLGLVAVVGIFGLAAGLFAATDGDTWRGRRRETASEHDDRLSESPAAGVTADTPVAEPDH